MAESEPRPRFWHTAVWVRGKVYVRGGSTPKFDTNEGKQELASKVEEYDPVNQAWRQLTTTGTLHPGLSAVACATSDEHLYAYGGFDGNDVCGVLSELNLKTLVWTRLSFEAEGGPMRKDASGMVYFDGEKLMLIGGYADPNGPIQQGSTFVLNEAVSDGSGWTNEFHVFKISKSSWFSPEIKGCRPPPCADFTLTSIDIHRAVLYGGCRPPERKCLDRDIYIIHFNTMEILRIEWKPGEVWPIVTVGHHAACCLGYNTEHPQLLVSGGRNCQDEPLGGAWLFDFTQKKWKAIQCHAIESGVPRWGHTATTITLPSKKESILIFGGTSANYQYGWRRLRAESFPRLTKMEVIQFGEIIGETLKENTVLTDKLLESKDSTCIPVSEDEFSLIQESLKLRKEAHRVKNLMIFVTFFCFVVLTFYLVFLHNIT